MQHHDFLSALALVLCVAAVTTVLFQRLHQPVVLGYVLAGMLVGPYLPVPVYANGDTIHTLSELGVILLMFSLGLEFSLRKFLKVGVTAGLTALIETSVLMWLGFMAARAFGWTARESLFTGSMLAISSTTIIAKAFHEQAVTKRLRQLVVSVLIVEDLIAIVLMSGLTAMGESETLSLLTVGKSSARLLAFLGGSVFLGLLLIPRAIRAIVALNRPETTLVGSVGICFALALLANKFGYSVALGAFLAGSLIAESGQARRIEPLVEPVRDVFAAVFFVSVGMSIDPHVLVERWQAILVLTLVVMVGKIFGVSMGAFLTGAGVRLSIRSGLSLAQIGEFSFIIAGLGTTLGATRDFLYPTVVAVSAITTLTTPFFIKRSESAASWVERKLPNNIQTFAVLYTGWVERMRDAPARRNEAHTKRYARLLAVDVVLLAGLIIGASRFTRQLAAMIEQALGLSPERARMLVIGMVIAAALPLCFGMVNVVRHLAANLTDAALPRMTHRPELGAAGRRALKITLVIAVLVLTGVPLLAVTQPFLSGAAGAALLAVAIGAFVLALLKQTQNLEGEVRAGSQLLVAALQHQDDYPTPASGEVDHFLAELGAPKPVKLTADCAAVGQTLVALDLRGSTGATVLAIAREPGGAMIPTGREVLREDDTLVLAGTHEAMAQAHRLLTTGRK
ncbi:MAG TPA: cation:proton antiporter [Polyangiales bacterium]|nr:cation:proton antiporter [Polyangiales bacterium]